MKIDIKTFLKALWSYKIPFSLSNKTCLQIVYSFSKLTKTRWLINKLIDRTSYFDKQKIKMLSETRLYLAYDGALDSPSRDNDLFFEQSSYYFQDKIHPKTEMNIALGNPEKFPNEYVK